MKEESESWLAIDYGSKRIGLAFADDIRVPVPLAAATEPSESLRLDHIQKVVAQKSPAALVLGYPVRPDGSAGQMAEEVDKFRERLLERFDLPVHLCDERNSSQEAGSHWNLRKSRKKRKTGQVDSAAATLILRDYLDSLAATSECSLPEQDKGGQVY
ncbi:MAG: Holliday junction resolvase RuvX [Verrucomicrobiota bacterium]